MHIVSIPSSSLNDQLKKKQEVLGRTNHLLSLIRHGPHRKRSVQQFFYCCVCIRYRGNVSTDPLPSNDKGNFTEPLPSNDKGSFTKPLPSNDRGDTQTHTQQPNLISLLYFFQNRKVGHKYLHRYNRNKIVTSTNPSAVQLEALFCNWTFPPEGLSPRRGGRA
jgi:hypothetical protein